MPYVSIMSDKDKDECIVCIGTLREITCALPLPLIDGTVKELGVDNLGIDSAHCNSPLSNTALNDEAELIANLHPCGHRLHDLCLKPWVDIANSCPICRQNFNRVDVSCAVGGK